MIIYGYANEGHLVREFLEATYKRKISIPEVGEVSLFIWGYEFWMPEGGKAGNSGAIDLLGTDELGNVWLIEAKQSGNHELCKDIWATQVLNYRQALSRRTHKEISRRSKRFLTNQGSAGVVNSYLVSGCTSLFDAFFKWASSQGKDTTFAQNMYNNTLQNIKEENIISAVLADEFRKEIWEARPTDSKSYAYLTVDGTGEEHCVHTVIDLHLSERQIVTDYVGAAL